MEIAKKDCLHWKNEFADETSLTVHKKRFLFLLDLLFHCETWQPYHVFRNGKTLDDYISFARTSLFSSLSKEKDFLSITKKQKKAHKREIAFKYKEIIGHPTERIELIASINLLLGPVLILYELIFFKSDISVLKEIASYLFGFSFVITLIGIICKLYLSNHFNYSWFIYYTSTRTDAFLANLDYEMEIISFKTSPDKAPVFKALEKNEGYQTLKSILCETECYFKSLLELNYIFMKDGLLQFQAPFSAAAFAELIKDTDFLFSTVRNKISDKVFIALCGKKFHNMEQRGIPSKKYPEIKSSLMQYNVPTTLKIA